MDTDTVGSSRLPEGRFVAATTQTPTGQSLNVVGVCIPWHNYRTHARWDERRKSTWQGNMDYLNGLGEDVLSNPRFQERTIIMGDFNLQIPPKRYPPPSHPVNHARIQAFKDFRIPTAEIEAGASDFEIIIEQNKPLVDHIALTPDLQPVALRVFSALTAEGKPVSDHNGVFMKVRV